MQCFTKSRQALKDPWSGSGGGLAQRDDADAASFSEKRLPVRMGVASRRTGQVGRIATVVAVCLAQFALMP